MDFGDFRHLQFGGIRVCSMSPFGGGGKAPDLGPAPSPIPRKVEVDVAAAEKEERELAGRRRGRLRSVLTRGIDLGAATTSQTELLGL